MVGLFLSYKLVELPTGVSVTTGTTRRALPILVAKTRARCREVVACIADTRVIQASIPRLTRNTTDYVNRAQLLSRNIFDDVITGEAANTGPGGEGDAQLFLKSDAMAEYRNSTEQPTAYSGIGCVELSSSSPDADERATLFPRLRPPGLLKPRPQKVRTL